MNLNLKKLNCLVIGGGAIGIGSALSLLLHGAENIFLAETNEIRHNKIKKTCDVQVFNPEKKIPFEEGSIDLVIDGVGIVKTREMSSKYISPGGLIVHIGLGEPKEGLDIRRMTLQEITFVGTYADTSPAKVSITGRAVIDPPPYSSSTLAALSKSLECK